MGQNARIENVTRSRLPSNISVIDLYPRKFFIIILIYIRQDLGYLSEKLLLKTGLCVLLFIIILSNKTRSVPCNTAVTYQQVWKCHHASSLSVLLRQAHYQRKEIGLAHFDYHLPKNLAHQIFHPYSCCSQKNSRN